MKTISYTPCHDCGEKTFSYNPFIIESGQYKISCTCCGRLLEGERAETALTDCGVLEPQQNT